MQTTTDHATFQAAELSTGAAYQRPQVTDLGAWNQMTLIYSLPIGPGTGSGISGVISYTSSTYGGKDSGFLDF